MSNQNTAVYIKQLKKEYGNGFIALKGIDLEIKKGDFFALLGPNGAGKSTTIGVLCSLVKKTSGTVKIVDVNIDDEPEKAKLLLGVVPQEFNFNQFEKVWEIVINQAGFYGVSKNKAEEKSEEYLKKLGLWDKRNEISRNLSGGMKRRLMIARALIHEPEILILDEPTAGVDIELRRTMWEFLKYINEEKGVTIILTTHYLEEAENLCRGIAIIDNGEIIESTTVKSLLNKLNKQELLLELDNDIEKIPSISGYKINVIEDKCLEVVIENGKDMNKLFSHLSKYGVNVISMRNKASRLESLFVEMTK